MKRSVLSAALVVVLFAGRALAGVLIQDSFTLNQAAGIANRTPDVTDVPGTKYQNGNSPNTISSGMANVGNDDAWAIAYNSSGIIQISADVNLNNMPAGAGGNGSDINAVGNQGLIGGVVLGFFPTPVSNLFAERQSPAGVAYSDQGELLLVEPSLTQNKVLAAVSTYNGGTPIPTTGTFNLSYVVNTTNGTVSDVTFGGFPIDFGTTASIFNGETPALAGQYARSGAGNSPGTLDNFTVSSVPEPGTISLIALGGIGLLVIARKRLPGRQVGMCAVLLAALVATTSIAGASQILVQDNFNSTDPTTGSNLTGRTPSPVNVPGNTWQTGGTFTSHTVGTDGTRGVANVNADEADLTSLSGLNASNPFLQVSAVFQANGGTEDGGSLYRGSGAGFFANGTVSQPLPANSSGYFTGLLLGPNSANTGLELKLEANPSTAFNANPIAALAYTGSLTNPTDYHTLTYTVNTQTGALSSVVLDGQSYSFGMVTAFTVAPTNNFGFLETSAHGGAISNFDSVTLTSVPEPGTWILLGLGSTLLLARGRSLVGRRAQSR